ncbi:MAG: hypothetical protein JO199_02910, partial [Candidatus Eremiobacteraeota bacterium]|nr:hypothetical protein [Candidatus Eremiobacteraeota bacterium]
MRHTHALLLATLSFAACSATTTGAQRASDAIVPAHGAPASRASTGLSVCTIKAAESGGTISIVNETGKPIPLQQARLVFTYAAPIANIWGTPWMAWTVVRDVNYRYTLSGGTPWTPALAPGATLTAVFTPSAGAHATSIVLRASCGARPPPTPSPTAGPTAPPGSTQFVGFWESWSDTNTSDAYNSLSSVPASVTTTDVAFSIANDNTIAPVQNYYPLLPGAQAIHARGGKVLLSFGGATSQFQITNVAQFVANLQAFQKANPGLYDGFDFDDEVMPWNGQQQLISLVNAVRAAFPTATISFDAFMSGADPQVTLATHQGEDRAIVQQAGAAIDYVNVMDYDQYGWKPSDHPNCTYEA